MQHSHASAFLISDLHLTPSMPLTAQRFFDFCEKEAREVEAVFILGDLFEYWVGDDANAQSPFHSEVKNALAALSSRVKTYYMHGNRDFLVGTSFLKKTGMTLLADPCAVQIAGDQYSLSHGDGLCTADSGYQLYRGWTRKPSTQKWFLRLPLSWRHAIADRLRKNIRRRTPAATACCASRIEPSTLISRYAAIGSALSSSSTCVRAARCTTQPTPCSACCQSVSGPIWPTTTFSPAAHTDADVRSAARTGRPEFCKRASKA
jgi:UDP-2,3-diacylglucosamine hydrolase